MSDFYYRGPDESTFIDRLERASLLAVDTETVSLNDFTMIGVGVYISDSEGAYFPAFPYVSEHMPLVMGKLSDPYMTKIYHNGNGFDLEVLKRFANEEGFSEPDDRGFEDTSIMAQVSGLPAGLQRLGQDWLEARDLFSISDLFDEFACRNMLAVPTERTAEKCLNDCRTTWQLYYYLNARLSTAQRDCYEVDRSLVSVLRRVESRGLRLRQRVLEDYESSLRRDILRIERECETEGFKPSSSLQVGYVLASRGNILPFTKGHRQLRVDEEVLEDLDDPLAAIVLEHRGKAKLLSTYVKPWLGKDRAYTHFRLDLATGRLASGKHNNWDYTNRNLQNIPPAMREIFKPDSGMWSWADHGQIELRVLAFMSRDPVMMDAYATNKDLHTISADTMQVPRANAKTFNFAMVYGGGDKVIARRAKIPLDQVKRMRAIWKGLYSGASAYMDRQQFQHGEYVDSEFGRRMRLPEMRDHVEYNQRAFEAHVGKCAINFPIQGTAADIVKRGMLQLDKAGANMVLQVHDEYLVDGDYDFPESLAHIHPDLHTPFETKKWLIWV